VAQHEPPEVVPGISMSLKVSPEQPAALRLLCNLVCCHELLGCLAFWLDSTQQPWVCGQRTACSLWVVLAAA
jgi:hypothetical protein